MNALTWPAIVAAWGILLAGATGVMKTTDAVRSWATTHLKLTFPDYTWILVPFGVGILTCLTARLNPLLMLAPTLPHAYSEVLSGIALGAIASPLHHGTAWLSALSKSVPSPPNDVPGTGQDVLDFAFGAIDTPAEGVQGPSEPTAPGANA